MHLAEPLQGTAADKGIEAETGRIDRGLLDLDPFRTQPPDPFLEVAAPAAAARQAKAALQPQFPAGAEHAMPGNLGIVVLLLEEHGDPAGSDAIAQGFRHLSIGRHAARRNLGQ